MNTPAIHQAMRLKRQPEDMAWLCFPDSDLPDGVTDLLRLCSSKELLAEFADTNGFDSEQLSIGLFNFIENVIVNKNNSDEKILGTDSFASLQLQKFHYQLLMKVYHPDHSTRPNAEEYTTTITKAYQRLKEKQKSQEKISFSESRRPPKSYYQATKKAETHISNTKTAIAMISAITIFAVVAMTGKFYDPANPELINADKSELNNTSEIIADNDVIEAQNLIKIISARPKNNQSNEIKTIEATNTKLQKLLKNLEVAYEEGIVSVIKPILANAPEIQDQSEKELNDKLETLFEITSERKMVLFDFTWTATTTGIIKGKGKFLSRYKLVGETKWLTREGAASVSANNINNNLKITQIILENQSID